MSKHNLYGRRWRKARLVFLKSNPTCRMCHQLDRVSLAEVVDHIIPHRGDLDLFWDRDNWQALCKSCHDTAKQQEEQRGFSRELDEDGWPVDPRHPANRPRSH